MPPKHAFPAKYHRFKFPSPHPIILSSRITPKTHNLARPILHIPPHEPPHPRVASQRRHMVPSNATPGPGDHERLLVGPTPIRHVRRILNCCSDLDGKCTDGAGAKGRRGGMGGGRVGVGVSVDVTGKQMSMPTYQDLRNTADTHRCTMPGA
jgi:hypothetical protein